MADNYIDILKRQNSGILIEEKDYSIYNITQFYNKVNLVIGTSKVGPLNIPILIISPENMVEIFGKRDRNLERKGSYFHKTIETMLTEGPVLAMNIRPIDNDLDQYNWQNISTTSHILNSSSKYNPLCDFFDTTTGFWKRSKEQLLNVVNDNILDSDKKPLSFINQGQKPVSLLMYKSDAIGFDVPAEDWYKGSIPDYIHPKEYVSEYLIDVLAVEGEWNNYEELYNHPKWGSYFDRSGIIIDKIQDFLNLSEVILIKQWTGSLIPYFKDNSGRNIYIETIINEDINETGIMSTYNTHVVEKDFRSGNIDLLGDNLTDNMIPQIDFLSYKRYLTDFFCITEKSLDNPSNSFGNFKTDINSRGHYFGEGFVNNVKMKQLIISTTTSLTIKPFDATNDAYLIINGNYVELDSDIEDIIALHETVKIGNKVAYVIVATDNGIEFRLGNETPIENSIYLPIINWDREYVLAYYIISQDISGNYNTELIPIVVGKDGYINPFRTDDSTLPKISTETIINDFQYKIVFESIYNFDNNSRDYNKGTIQHMWFWLSENLKENISLCLDTNGHKQVIQYIEHIDSIDDKCIRITSTNRDSDININSSSTSGVTEICLYMNDDEFLVQDETKWREQIESYVETEGYFGVMGADSDILNHYYSGMINSGDPFFWGLSDEYDVEFLYDDITKQNLIVFKDSGLFSDYEQRTIIMKGTEYNDGIFTFLNFVDYNGDNAIVVQEKVINESIEEVSIFDAENPRIVNLYFINGKLQAKVELFDGEPKELYERLFLKEKEAQWAKTLEIEEIIESNKVLVDAERYQTLVKENYFLLAQTKKLTDNTNGVQRTWTRIIDSVIYDKNPDLLLVMTDQPIKFKSYNGDIQTEMLQPIYDWVDTLDFKVLDPFIPRTETFPDGSEERLNDILNTIAPTTKLAKALTTEQLDWRYLVDSYGLGLIENSKYQLANIVERKQLALGFLNAPSVKDFRKSSDVVYNTNGMFDTQKLLKGGERKNSASKRYSFSDVGQSHVAYCFPYVAVTDGNRFRLEPPATHIAKNYMRKFNNSTPKQPWEIMAGVNSGRIRSVVGIEEQFNPEELQDLNKFGFTTLASGFKNNIYYTHNENTASSGSINSSLSYIHVREVLIELETRMSIELEKYQWTEYTNINVANILRRANDICQNIKDNNGIYEYNNETIVTDELKDSQLLILNTYIEPIQGMGTIVLRVSVAKTGQILSISSQV